MEFVNASLTGFTDEFLLDKASEWPFDVCIDKVLASLIADKKPVESSSAAAADAGVSPLLKIKAREDTPEIRVYARSNVIRLLEDKLAIALTPGTVDPRFATHTTMRSREVLPQQLLTGHRSSIPGALADSSNSSLCGFTSARHCCCFICIFKW